jgi:hypothetical protein
MGTMWITADLWKKYDLSNSVAVVVIGPLICDIQIQFVV